MQNLYSLSDNVLYSYSSELLISFGLIFVVFIGFVLLSIYFRKNNKLSFFFIFFALFIIIIAPIISYNLINNFYKTTNYQDLNLRQLVFKQEAVLKGHLANSSDKVLKNCKIIGKLYGKTDSKFKQFFSLIRPKSTTQVVLNTSIYPKESQEFKLVFKRISYDDNLSLSLKTRCK